MKKTEAAILCIAMFVTACEKQELNVSENRLAAIDSKNSAFKEAKKQELTITIQPPAAHPNGSPNVLFYSNGQFLEDGDMIFDNCDYMNLKPSSGKVKIQENGLSPEYLITINEKRSGAIITAVGEPYYWIQFEADPLGPALRFTAADLANVDTTYFRYDKIGPFRDTTSTGTGLWTIAFSSNSLIKNGSGTVNYSAYIKYDFSDLFYQEGDGNGTLNDIGRRVRQVSTLTGTYQK